VVGALILNTRNTPELTPRPGLFVLKGFLVPLAVFVPVFLLIFHFKAML
jgi:hypothetical protein